MTILILGGDGMLGHELARILAATRDVHVTLRRPLAAYHGVGAFSERTATGEVDARDWPRVRSVVSRLRPAAVINCIGIVKQRAEAKSPIPSLEINSLLPHRLNELCAGLGARLLHFSTDCVFSGRQGGYGERDRPDPVDLYGHTKLLGEVSQPPGLTLRTSIVGLEQRQETTGLIEWFLAQRGIVRGFRRAIYTGLTTPAMGRLVARLLEQHPDLSGLWHVGSAPISKFDLLLALAQKLGRTDVTIVPDDEFACDRSLDSTAFRAAIGYEPPTWDVMLSELADQIQRRETRQSPA